MTSVRITATALALLFLPSMAKALACSPNNCENGSTCQDNLLWYICICPAEFRGRHCENAITGPIPIDAAPPTVMGCPTDIVKTTSSSFEMAEWTAPTAVDENNVHLVLQTHFPNQNFFPIGTTEVAYIFADDFANIANCSFTISLLTGSTEDNLPPTVEFCPTNIIREVPVGTPSIQVFWDEPIVTDDGDDVKIEKQTASSGSTFFVNTQTAVLYEFSDDAENIANCMFTVTVIEEAPPSPCEPNPCLNGGSCENLGVNVFSCLCTAAWSGPICTDPTAVTAPSPCEPNPCLNGGSCENFGVNVFSCLCAAAWSGPICTVPTVLTAPPTISNCPSDIVLYPNETTGEAVAFWNPPVAEDDDGPVFLISQPPSPGISVPSGSNRSVEYIYSDLDHNQAVCAFNIIVLDLDLSITCPGDIQRSTDGQTDTVVVTWEELTVPAATDYRIAGTHISGTPFSIGITDVSYTLLDQSGNRVADCSFQIEILAYEAPSLVCPPDMTVYVTTPEDSVEVTWQAPNAPTAGQSLTASRDPGSFSLGVHEITYYLFDSVRLLASCSFFVHVVEVEDLAPPMLVGCPTEPITETVGPGESSTTVDWAEPTPAEHPVPVQVFSSHLPGGVFHVGQSIVTYTVVDENGNTGDCSFIVQVLPFVDSVPPTVTGCPTHITLYVFPGSPDPTAEWNIPTAEDDYGDARLVHDSNQPGDVFPRGLSVVTYIFEDQYNNTAFCSFSISVNEIPEPFLFNCPFVVRVNAEFGLRGSEVTWEEPFVTTSLNRQNLTRSHPPGSFFPVGISTVTYSFTFPEIPGYSLNCTFIVNVMAVDDIPPSVLYCPGDITKLVNDPMETPTIRWNEPVVEDNSGILPVADQTQVSGTEFPIGETEVVYNFKDESENVAECRFQVSIQYKAAAVILPVTFVVQEVYSDDLSNTTSDAYTAFGQSLTNALDGVITSRRETRNSFGGFSIVQLRPGSIIAEVEIWFDTDPPVTNITSFFNNILTRNIESGFGHLGQLVIVSTNVGLPELSPTTTSVPKTGPISSDVSDLPPMITSNANDVSVSAVSSLPRNLLSTKPSLIQTPRPIDRETSISLLFVVIMAPVGVSILILILSLSIWACQICGKDDGRPKEKPFEVTGSDHPLGMVEETTHSSEVSSSHSPSTSQSSLGNTSGMKRDRYINVDEEYDITNEHGLDEAEEAEGLRDTHL